jgi:hypothetical protein
MIPLFCQGKAIQRETSQAVGMGARLIPTADANNYFHPGERIFISEPDATEVEFLGMIQSVASDSITVELATEAGKSEGAKLWTPQAVFEWPSGAAGEVRRSHHSGVEVVRSLGGVAYATRLRSAYEIESVRFENLTDGRFEQLSSWLGQQANDGLEEFTYVDPSRMLWRVRLDAPTLESSRNARDLVVIGFNLHLLSQASYI